jgi:serine phosphatase RsbU (regulator of sigma subunit)
LSIDAIKLERLVQDNFKDSILYHKDTYDEIHHVLKNCFELNQLESPIYTLHKNKHSNEFEFGVTSSKESYFKHTYSDYPEKFNEVYWTGGNLGRYTTHTGEYLSYIHPIRNAEEEVIGAIELDLPFDFFVKEAKNSLLKKSGISLAVYIVIGLAVFRLISKIVNLENEEKNLAIEKQKMKDYEHQELASSMTYARKIQNALWPSNEIIRDQVADFFSINMPKDVVGGDFYWHYKIPNKNQFVVIHADCTGHGVPGAMMSVLGNSIFSQLVVNFGVTEPKEILNLANKKLIELLQQEREGNVDDGMAVSAGLIDVDKMTLKFSGAHQNALIVRNGQSFPLKGDKYPVGGAHYNINRSYSQETFLLEKDDTFYLFSDGFKDQFGGPANKKFLTSKFYNLLVENSLKAMDVQKEIILNAFRKWKGNHEQIDDISLVGIKL